MCAVWNLVEEFVQIHYIFFFIDEYADSWILFKSNKSEWVNSDKFRIMCIYFFYSPKF